MQRVAHSRGRRPAPAHLGLRSVLSALSANEKRLVFECVGMLGGDAKQCSAQHKHQARGYDTARRGLSNTSP